MNKLILGSQSPRRKEILSYFSLPFEQITPLFDEDSVLFSGDPVAYVSLIAEGKGNALREHFPNKLILTADTTVYKEGKIYGKPVNTEEAFQALSELAGTWHSVFTGVSLCFGEKTWTRHEETRVLFNTLTPEEIRHYHAKLHWSDKAGGYAIQMAGGLAIQKIDGCYYNAMGLPINTVRHLLLNVGIDLWDYLK
ncbi:MAG: Maf family nucleotide pyrophosphatase [Parachlamydiaceae bacterium]